jgi:hypothetical protein
MLTRAARGGANPPGRGQSNATHEATFPIIEIVEAVEEMRSVLNPITESEFERVFAKRLFGRRRCGFSSVPSSSPVVASTRNKQVPAK